MSGSATFGVLSFHLAPRALLPAPAIPLPYAAAMALDALVTGFLHDRIGTRVLIALPLLAAARAGVQHQHRGGGGGLAGVGAAVGIQGSTLRAVVADLVPPARRATGYGIFAGAHGAALIGGTLAGRCTSSRSPS